MARAIHHWDLWVEDLDAAAAAWGWLLTGLGWSERRPGPGWAHPDGTYLHVERSPDQRDDPHDRLRPGVNHVALTCPDRATLDLLRDGAPRNGWAELFADRYPHAGGPDHVALFLEDAGGIEVEVVVP